MKIVNEIESLSEFGAWSGGQDTINDLTEEQLDSLFPMIEEAFPEGLSETELNDFLWFERELIAEWLGFEDYDALLAENNT
jgi:hypothetical protein